ncbi:hypothetical protein DCAR_0934179 [Daucus carota subsp. sativus]|uniref:RING-type domain-containing protein n=1 Tax=Daucus carota subsp. sativus TaxID=79200 RepID=A0AAF1BCI7_DAUCS|nr:PREDICTED: E3 ubiquitin ligase BIG BROTHER [Daucus carota subsp. sativus]WOH14659.1 hypothetical protein DCAR_0934179 [Daucus carota subsp. sativus]
MDGNRQMEVHYINTGCPYTVTESFMDFFEGLTNPHEHYAHAVPMQQYQETAYWVNAYKFGLPASEIPPYYGHYVVNDYLPRNDISRRAWEYPTMSYNEQPTATEIQAEENSVATMEAIPEECTTNHETAANSQDLWQDNIDPDNMTYEELLDLGEAVGTQSRGLAQELIDLLPTSKYKSSGFFFKKRSKERCVICQMRYKRGDRQIRLPCKHVYHSECVSKWLSINKICPICSTEVFSDESKH